MNVLLFLFQPESERYSQLILSPLSEGERIFWAWVIFGLGVIVIALLILYLHSRRQTYRIYDPRGNVVGTGMSRKKAERKAEKMNSRR